LYAALAGGAVVKLMLCVAVVAVTVSVTVGAAEYKPSPGWLAITEQVPVLLVMVKVAPALPYPLPLHDPEEVNTGISPEVDVAVTVKVLP